MAYQIVTDSASNLPEEIIDEFGLEVLPLVFFIDGAEYKSYLKGEHVNLKHFYDQMREGKIITTSLVNMHDAEMTCTSILDQDKDILYLGFSSGLSSNYNTMSIVLNDLQMRYPHRTIISLDTYAASLGQGLLVWQCCKRAQQGQSLEEVASYARKARNKVCHWFTVDDLMFLMRGGRLNKTSAIAGTVLNIKPILHVNEEGLLVPMDKVRGRKKALKELVKRMKESITEPQSQTIFISHGDCLDDVEVLKKLIEEELDIHSFVVNYIDPVIGAHSGPGTIALFFMGTKK